MSAEIEWLPDDDGPAREGPRCRYCARLLTDAATDPGECQPHCAAFGCRWCVECYAGATSVSPRYGLRLT